LQLSESIRDQIQALLAEAPQRNPYKRFTILAYQLGDVGKCMRYMQIYPEERKAQAAYLKTAMADLLIQVVVFAELYGLDINQLADLGARRLEEFKKKSTYVEHD